MDRAFTFDDILLVPQYSEVLSRKDCNVNTKFTRNYSIGIPIVGSPMDTVCSQEMVSTLDLYHAVGCLYRFQDLTRYVDSLKCLKTVGVDPLVAVVGVTGDYLDRAISCTQAGASIILLDVAHGDHILVKKAISNIRYACKVDIIAGSIATRDAALRLEDWGADAVRVGIGNGCFAGGTRVLLSNGEYRNIEDIKLHDKVITGSGEVTEVLSVKYSGMKNVIKYKTNSWYTASFVTPEHLHWGVKLSAIDNVDKKCLVEELDKHPNLWTWIRAEEPDAVYALPKNIKFEIPDTFTIFISEFAKSSRGFTSSSKLIQNVTPCYDLGYVFGTFLGDGNARLYKIKDNVGTTRASNTCGELAWSFGLNEGEIAEKLILCLKNTFGAYAKTKTTKNMIKVICRNNPLVRLFREFDKHQNKHLPSKYLSSNKDYLQGILDGLVDSDGHVERDNNRISFSNTSKVLIEQYSVIFYLVNGYFPSMTYADPTKGNLENCKLENCHPRFGARNVKNPKWLHTTDYQINRVNKRETVELLVPTYDIEVADDTHSFIANNVIVHNSACSTRVNAGTGFPQGQAILEIANSGITIPIIADGGVKNPGDFAKAIALGADSVMFGSMLAACQESPAEYVQGKDGVSYKKYRGSASAEAKALRGETSFVEGASGWIPCTGTIEQFINRQLDGLRSAMSYSGALTIEEFQNKVLLTGVSQASYLEGTPHAFGKQ